MDDSLYDEFGNYIGPLSGSESDQERDVPPKQDISAYFEEAMAENDAGEETSMQLQEYVEPAAIVLHEEKRYYPSASEVYGGQVEAMVQEEDTQLLSEPIIAPIKVRRFAFEEGDAPAVNFSRDFMCDLMAVPEDIRNVAIVGHLHHGKTAFVDMLVEETHNLKDSRAALQKHGGQIRYTDATILERERGLSLKCSPMSLVLSSIMGKSYLVHLIDTPGHVDFVDEVASAVRLVDGIVLIVDAVEGMQVNTTRIIHHAVRENMAITLVINKIDRLILELNLPPNDAYFKLRHTIEQVNSEIASASPKDPIRLTPDKGTVLFASSRDGWSFSLMSFAKMYADKYAGIDAYEFSRRLWGNVYYSTRSQKFVSAPEDPQMLRSFVFFILEPLYKLYAHTIGEEPEKLDATLKSIGIRLKPKLLKKDSQSLLKIVCKCFFGPSNGFVTMLADHISSPVTNASKKLQQSYLGPMDTTAAEAMVKCDPKGPLQVHLTKLFASSDGQAFYAFGRIFSGTLKNGERVRVLGENYALDDEEDAINATISNVWIANTRYNIAVNAVPAGNLVLLGGIGNAFIKTATLLAQDSTEDAFIFCPIRHMTEPVFKVSIEPLHPSELPKMLEGIRKINKTYPLLVTRVEESGEHIIIGVGELYVDCVMYDLRKVFAEIDIKISNPVTRFCETVLETSAIKCYALTPNKKNKISMVAGPLDNGLAEDIEAGRVKLGGPPKEVGKFFEANYGWDILASRSVWAFGPDDQGPNILLDDTLPTETDKSLLESVRASIRQGFQWGVREGPLCEEPMRNTKFKIMDASFSSEAIHRGGGQIIPTARRVCYSSFLTASPRLMEPMYACSMTGPADAVNALYAVLAKRRGHVTQDIPIAGTPLFLVSGLIPVMDSFGFETDVRIHTQGQAMCSLVFDKWQIVPGDPLDSSIVLRPLEQASAQAMARDFVLKTRRRKGLSDDVNATKYLDEELVAILKQSGVLNRSM